MQRDGAMSSVARWKLKAEEGGVAGSGAFERKRDGMCVDGSEMRLFEEGR